jgi:hypothetical protein
MRQMGHTTVDMTVGVSGKVMERRDGEPERLRALVEGEALDATGDERSVASEAGETRSSA